MAADVSLSDDDLIPPDGTWDGFAEDLENARPLSKDDPGYNWAESEAKAILARKFAQREFNFFTVAPNPTFDLNGNKVAYLLRDSIVVVWDPERAWPEFVVRKHCRCIRCNGPTVRAGRSKLRRVCGLRGNFYFCGIKYRCPHCPHADQSGGSTCFDSKHPEVMARMPDFVQRELPVILTTKGAIDRDMMELINHDVTNGQSFQSAAERIAQTVHREHTRHHLSYLQYHAAKQTKAQQPGTQAKLADVLNPAHAPPQFDQLGVAGLAKPYIPSGQYLSGAWLEAVQPVVQWAKRHMSGVKGKCLCLDHTFRSAKYVRTADGQQAYKCILTVYNEHGLVLGQYFTHTTSMLEVKEALLLIAARYEKGDGPEYIWVDNSDICGPLLKSIFPTVKQVMEDSTHLMRRYMRTLMPDHPQNQAFMTGLSKAMFEVHEPDVAALKAQLLHDGKMTPEKIADLKFSYFKKRCRCVIPDKQKLEANLTNLMNTKFPDGAGTGIVTDATWEAHERALKIVREGRVSDPMELEAMYYNRSQNPAKPKWITVRGSSKLEGYHPHLHACLPGTNYSPYLADAIITLFNFSWNYKRSVTNAGQEDHGFPDLWMLEQMQQLCHDMKWSYELPSWQSAPACTVEKFGLEFVPHESLLILAEAEAKHGKSTVTQPLSDEAEELLAVNTRTAISFLDDGPTSYAPARTSTPDGSALPSIASGRLEATPCAVALSSGMAAPLGNSRHPMPVTTAPPLLPLSAQALVCIVSSEHSVQVMPASCTCHVFSAEAFLLTKPSFSVGPSTDVQPLQQAGTPATTSRPVTASASPLHAPVSSFERSVHEAATNALHPVLGGIMVTFRQADNQKQGGKPRVRGKTWQTDKSKGFPAPCVVCKTTIRESVGRTKHQAWRFHEPVCDKDNAGATCCVRFGTGWMHKECHTKHKAHFKLVKDMQGEFQVQLQPPVNRQAVPLHAAAAVPSPAAAGAAAAAGVGAAAPLKTSSAATATSVAGTAGDHSPNAAAAAATAAFCLNTTIPFPAALLHQQGPSKQTSSLLAMAASSPVCAAESADATHALHAAVYGLDQGALLHSADSMSPQPSPSALAQLPAGAAEAHAAATPLAICLPTTRLAPDFAAVSACQASNPSGWVGQLSLGPLSERAMASTASATATSAVAMENNVPAASDDASVQAAEQAGGPVSGSQLQPTLWPGPGDIASVGMPAAWEIEQSVAPDLSFPLLAGPSSQYDDGCLMQGAHPGVFEPVRRDISCKAPPEVVIPAMLHNPLNNVGLEAESMRRLESRDMIDDDVLNYILGLMELQSVTLGPCAKERWLFLHSWFMEKLYPNDEAYGCKGVYNFDAVKSWFDQSDDKLRHLNGFPWHCHTHIFVPVNLTLSHWFALVINMRLKVIVCYDSMQGDRTHHMVQLAKWVKQQMGKDVGFPNDFEKVEFELRHATDIPRQGPTLDCGIFVCQYAMHLLASHPMNFSQRDMPDLRKKLVNLIKSSSEGFPPPTASAVSLPQGAAASGSLTALQAVPQTAMPEVHAANKRKRTGAAVRSSNSDSTGAKRARQAALPAMRAQGNVIPGGSTLGDLHLPVQALLPIAAPAVLTTKRTPKRGPRRKRMPIDDVGDLQTEAEISMFFTLRSQSKSEKGAPDFVAMATKFNMMAYQQTSAVASGRLTLADAQQRLRVTSIGKLQAFDTKLAKMIHQQDADSIARSLDLQNLVKESCFLESVGIPIIHNVPVEAFSQQLRTDHARQARADRKHKMSAALPVALAAVQPTAQPALGRRGAPGKPRTCTACKKPKLGTHDRTGCPTHCLTCKNLKASCTCQPPVPPNLP